MWKKPKNLLLKRLEDECEHEMSALIQRKVEEAKETAEDKSREIISAAIQRYAAEQTCEVTVSTVEIPNDDMKGRVIGREGRNIRAFEKATGVDVIVDDTPGMIVVSGFNPVRREVARLSMERLIQDGRIHPSRIEELVEQTKKEINAKVLQIGKDAAVEANVRGLNNSVLSLLGALNYRTSYGQNVLRHSVEVAFLAQVMADELGLDGSIARRAGLLHDIGKAIDHEIEGGHPDIGANFLKRFNESSIVILTASKATMAIFRRIIHILRWFPPPMPSVHQGRVPEEKRSKDISSGLRSSKKSQTASRVLKMPMRFRRAAKSA